MSNSSSAGSRILQAEPLTAAGFASFGTVLEAGDKPGRVVNQGRAQRIEGDRNLSHQEAMTPVVDLYRIDRSELPFSVSFFERHPLSSQIFTPMSCARYLVVVAPDDADGNPDISRAVAFLGRGMQAICYRRGTWHAPMVALDESALMTMLMWEAGDPWDCEEFSLGEQRSLIVQG